MHDLKVRCRVLVISVLAASILYSVPLAHAKTITQAKYVVLLTEQLGLRNYLLPEDAIKILESFYIVPSEGWQLNQDVSCELLDEVQVLMITSTLKGVIRNDWREISPLMDSLSYKYNICPESRGVIYSTETSPTSPIDSVSEGDKGSASRVPPPPIDSVSGGGKGSASE